MPTLHDYQVLAKHHKINHFGPCDCTGIRLKEVM